MKATLIILVIFIYSLNSFSQNFAPIGAKWHFTVVPAMGWPGDEYYMTVESIRDSLINGHNFTEVKPTYSFCDGYQIGSVWLYEENGIVSLYDTSINFLQTLFNFNATVNDSWVINYRTQLYNLDSILIVVDSTGIEQINNNSLRVLYVKYKSLTNANITYSSKIIERIGDMTYLFNMRNVELICDMDWPVGLRCYEDLVFGSYSTGLAPSCTYIYNHVGINDNIINAKEKFIIFYNLSNNKVNVNVNTDNNCMIILYNEIGQKIKELEFQNQLEFNINDFRNGLYFAKIINAKDNYFEVKKIMKTQ